MVIVGVGGNLQSAEHGSPVSTCTAALVALDAKGIMIVRQSRWYRSLPFPISNQPPFVNGVIEVECNLGPDELLAKLHSVEADFGRKRDMINAARVLDLDLLACGNEIRGSGSQAIVPHPRMHERAFVLKPLAEIEPRWRHPSLGLTVSELLDRIPPGQYCELLDVTAH